MSNCPCNGCDRRLVGCHGLCPEYQSWKKSIESRKAKPKETPEFPKAMKKYIWRNMRWR